MPITKNAITRYFFIDKMLANRNRSYSIKDIATELSTKLNEVGLDAVSKRCVEKDLHYFQFESPFDIDIEEYWIDAADCNGRPYRKRCIRYSDPTFSIFKSKLTDYEKSVLSSALNTLGCFDGLENFKWLNDLRERLKIEESNAIISISKNLLENSTLIAQMFTVIKNEQVITLSYHTFTQPDIRQVNITPHILKEYNNRWFLIASACDTGKLLTFPLDRIDGFSNNYLAPFIKAPEDIEERFDDIIGITFNEDATVETIIFWISDSTRYYLETKPIHGSQTHIRGEQEKYFRLKYPSLKNGEFYRIKCIENYELIRELSSFGPECIVISPNNLRDTILSRLSKMLEMYNNIN